MKLFYTKKFDRQLHKSPLSIKKAFRDARELFREDQLHPVLNNHALKRTLKGLRSINVTAYWRAIYSEKRVREEIVITFEMLGTHKQLYK